MNRIKDFKYFYGYSKTFPIQRHLQQQDVYLNENSNGHSNNLETTKKDFKSHCANDFNEYLCIQTWKHFDKIFSFNAI